MRRTVSPVIRVRFPVRSFWGVGQAAKLQPFHGCEMGSIPIRPTTGESAVILNNVLVGL